MMDLPPTQEIDNSMEISQKDSQNTSQFPSLLPLRPEFPTIEINKNEYTFGRAECDYIFSAAQFNEKVQYGTLSKVHFKIIREANNHGFVTFLQDCSSNGTFVNEVRVGKGKRVLINNSDRISLSIKTFYCFIFSDVLKTSEYPIELSSKYTVTMTLGSGACGEVKLVYSKENDQKFAMKIISKKNLPSWNDNYLELPEVNILKQLRHPCIIKLHDVINGQAALYIILELVEGGELYDRLVKDSTSEHEARFLFLQMVLAIKYLHDKGISHRDLKPENILLTKKEGLCLVKVTDFGLSKLVDGTSLLKTFCGTPTYLAPEILRSAGMGTYTHSVDVWSLGVILYICLVGYPPFTDDRKDMDLRGQILNGSFDFDPNYWSDISEEAKDLVRKMLVVDPNERITLKQALDHPWLNHEATKVDLVALMQREAGFVPNDLASYAILPPDCIRGKGTKSSERISSPENMMC